MLFILDPVIAALTFPGVIAHQAARQLICRVMNIPVLEVCYFRFGDPSGILRYESANDAAKQYLICVAPLFCYTILGAVLGFPLAMAFAGHGSPQFVDILFGWLGFSLVMHAFPSQEEVTELFAWVRNSDTSLLMKIIGWPTVMVFKICSIASIYCWFYGLFAILFCFGLSNQLVVFLAGP